VSAVPATDTRKPNLLARPLMAVIHGYQVIRAGRPSPCRFDPSCSAYAVDALEAHGAARGTILALRRLGRCHPWGGQGYDPVPQKKARH
jgi:putative membrane protein insertion efficiency factor